MPKVLVIADDFTGAAEIGGIAHLFGLSVKMQTSRSETGESERMGESKGAGVSEGTGVSENTGVSEGTGKSKGACVPENTGVLEGTGESKGAGIPEDDVLVLDTNTRSLNPQIAYNTIITILEELDLSAFDFIYKKVDSVLRGPIIPEINAILSIMSLDHVVLVSANPSKGRIIKDGIYLIDGKPIDQTEFQYDPEYPRNSPLVRDLVSNTVNKGELDQAYKEDNIDIPDAYSEDNLNEIVSRIPEGSLTAGGADFFTALLKSKLNLKQSIRAAYTHSGGYRHFVIGTRSVNCLDTINRLHQQGYPCFYLPEKSLKTKAVFEEFNDGIVEAIEKGHPLIIARPEDELSGSPALRKITELLSGSAITLISRCKPGDEIFIEGGETASCIISQQKSDLRISEVPGAGVVKLELIDSGIFLIVKPGSYPWPNTIFNFS